MTDARTSDPRPTGWRRSLLGAALIASSSSSCAAAPPRVGAAPAVGQQVLRAGARAVAIAPADHFTGPVRVEPLFPLEDGIAATGAYVTFDAGAHSHWHTHAAGQRLVVIAGAGLTQEWGEPAQVLRPGDVVVCPPGVKHWHGAAPTSALTHLTVTGSVAGRTVTWMEPVTAAQYAAAAGQVAPPRDAPATGEPALSARQRAIPAIAAFAATSQLPRLQVALNQGLDAGLTISEAKEVLVQLYAYVGFPRSLNALGELMKVVEARKQRGAQDAPGREPSRVIPTGDALIAIGAANQTRISGAPVRGPLFDFAPIINQYLQAHLFGDIFERDNLDWPSRELATVGALAATPGAEPQLRSHMAASLRLGLTAGQLRQVSEVLAEHGERDAARRADDALAQALAATNARREPTPRAP